MINLLGQEIIETRESSDKEAGVKEWGENRSERADTRVGIARVIQ